MAYVANLVNAFRTIFPFPTIGQLVFLYYYDRFGIFKILNEIIADYRFTGKFPITQDPGTSGILDLIHLLSNSGQWTNPKDRESTYRRCLGWTLYNPSFPPNMQINHQFANIHKFINLALEYYNQKQIAVAIRGSQTAITPSSVATESAIRNTGALLQNSFVTYSYGTNMRNTLLGLLGIIVTVLIVYNIRGIIGIPTSYVSGPRIINAAYDILIAKRPVTHSGSDRFEIHDVLASRGQRILERINLFDFQAPDPPQPPNDTTNLSTLLTALEEDIEAYRTNYRILTGTDLGKPDAKTDPKQVIKIVA